ncbi:hypothetical protein BOTBODRAFT_142595 [Botryobasidium botryosum FD-172 SS1]|uniref:Uncharacterized protein n=1 Tax=Botryobasidium botryosum (strain FD-172 SS1) TaxID=930990 RepID=A0A067MW24_BOTB1|nr:hypothetical protein BOTBODRAFT_142595 [Botryobasidium botryosum FD-172 SS1]
MLARSARSLEYRLCCTTLHPRHAFSSQAFLRSEAAASAPAGSNSHKSPPKSPSISDESEHWKRTVAGDTPVQLDKPALNTSISTSNVEAYLESLMRSGQKPTLEDLSKFQPRKRIRPLSSGYPKLYNDTVLSIDRSFTFAQLRELAKELKLFNRSTNASTKAKLIGIILDQSWGMPHPVEVERKKKEDTAVSEREFPVTSEELFLLLGKDGSDLLQLSAAFDARIFLKPSPLALRVQGPPKQLSKLGRYLAERKKSITSEIFLPPSNKGIRADLVQTVSRLAGAFVENLKDGQVRIAANDPKRIATAKRLVTCAANLESLSTFTSTLAHLAPPPELYIPPTPPNNNYALYPHIPPGKLPWTIGGASAFRARRVGHWLSYDNEGAGVTAGLFEKEGHFKSLKAEEVGLQSFLSSLNQTPQGHAREIRASVGHVLFTSLASSGQRSSLVPPLPGSMPFNSILEWLDNGKGRTTFVPSVPPALLGKVPTTRAIAHRLVYRYIPGAVEGSPCPPSKILEFEIVREHAATTPDISLEQLEPGEKDLDTAELSGGARESRTMTSPTALLSYSKRGEEVGTHLLLPDRPVDVHLTVRDTQDILAEETPTEIQEYVSAWAGYFADEHKNSVAPRPRPPQYLGFEGVRYDLESSVLVRSCAEQLPNPNSTDIFAIGQESPPIYVTLENATDLDTDNRVDTCHIECTDDWQLFIQQLDRLTLPGPRAALFESPDHDTFA